jgi:methylase of polypeptide subunit release factors
MARDTSSSAAATNDRQMINDKARMDPDYKGRMRMLLAVAAAAGLAIVLVIPAAAQTPARPKLDVIYIPTPQPVVDAMLELAQIKRSDVVYDLGSGDGRLVITAAKKYGASGVGIELDPVLVKKARENAAAAGVSNRVRFVTQSLYTADLSRASVVTLYLLQSINERLRPRLVRQLKPGSRIVSHVFNMGPEWPPEKTVTVERSRIFLWSIPRR